MGAGASAGGLTQAIRKASGDQLKAVADGISSEERRKVQDILASFGKPRRHSVLVEKAVGGLNLGGEELAGHVKLSEDVVPRQHPPEIAFVIDCGSAHTAVFRYKLVGEDLEQDCHRFKRADGTGVKICDLLSAGPDAWQDFLNDYLWEDIGVDREEGAPVLFGCTAGVRRAIDKGKVTQASLDGFSEAVHSRWPGRRAEVRVITGREEAEFELVAARLLAGQNDCGLFSGGGASCQIALGDGPGRQVHSLVVGTVEAKEVFERVGQEAGWTWWQERLAEVKNEIPDLPEGGFRGTFIGTAMQCTCAKWHARLPLQTKLSRDAVLAALDPLVEAFLAPEEGNAWMAELRAEAHSKNAYGKWTDENADEKWKYFKLIWLPGATRMQAMVRDLFAPEASFIFINEVEMSPGQKMKAEWTLGSFLTIAQHAAACPDALFGLAVGGEELGGHVKLSQELVPNEEHPPKTAYVIDCGSAHTAVFRYKLVGTDLEQDCHKFHDAHGKGTKLCDLLSAGPLAWDAFLNDTLWDDIGVDQEQEAPVLFGCTAGVRRAVDSGKVTQAALDGFSEAVRKRWPGRCAEVQVITGREEAEFELVAARLLAGQNDCGLFSGGGASCQIALGDGPDRRVHSLLVGTVEAKEVFERDGQDAGWAWWQERLAAVKNEIPDLPEGGFRGTFIGTAMQCTCAKWHARLPLQTKLSRDAVLAALDPLVEAFLAPEEGNAWMDELRAEARSKNAYGKWTDENADEKWKYFKLIWLPGATRMQAMVRDLFAPEVSFIFINEVEMSPGQKMKAEWTLGRFLTLVRHAAAAGA